MGNSTDASNINTVMAIGAVAGLLVLSWIVILAPHVYRIIQPSIVAYPWEDDEDDDDDDDDRKRKASHRTVVFAASYNPPHHGHLRMLEYLSKNYDRVIAVVGFNPNKQYLVSPEDRADLLRKMLDSRSIDVAVEGESLRVAVRCVCRASERVPSGCVAVCGAIRSDPVRCGDCNRKAFRSLWTICGHIRFGSIRLGYYFISASKIGPVWMGSEQIPWRSGAVDYRTERT